MKSLRAVASQMFSRPRNWMRFAAALIVFAGVASSLVIAQNQAKFENEAQSANLIRLRSHWFAMRRAFPLHHIPTPLRLKAYEQMRAMQQAAQFSVDGAIPNKLTAGTWTAIGPAPSAGSFFGNVSGRVLSAAFDSCDPTGNRVYIGGAEGGVWRTDATGMTFVAMGDTAPSLATASIAVDTSTCVGSPGFASRILVGTGEDDFGGDIVFQDSIGGAGVLTFTTTDGINYNITQDKTFSAPGTIPLDQFDNGPRIGAVALAPGNHLNALAALRGSGSTIPSGIWQSLDGGQHFSPVLIPGSSIGSDVTFDFIDATGKTAYAAIGTDFAGANQNNDVYKSIDGGTTWSVLTSLNTALTTAGFAQADIGRITMTVGAPIAMSTHGVLYVAIADARTNSGAFLGLFKSVDGGTTFTHLAAAPAECNNQCFFDMVVRASPVDGNIIFFAGAAGAGDADSIERSVDGGTTWTNVTTALSGEILHVDFHAITFTANGHGIGVGNDGGVWGAGGNGGANITATPMPWVNFNNSPLQLGQVYPGISVDPTTDNNAFFGAQDNGFSQFSGSTTWNNITGTVDGATGTCGDGAYTIVDPKNNQNVFAACVDFGDPNSNLVNKSTNGGATFVKAVTGINRADGGEFVPPLVIDPEATSDLYFGTCVIYQSLDGGNTWTPITMDLTGTAVGATAGNRCPAASVSGGLTAIAVAPKNSNVVYAVTGASFTGGGAVIPSNLVVSTNALNASPTFTPKNTGLPPRFADTLAVDPSDATGMIAYVGFSGFSGFNGDNQGHVFKTTNGGGQWTDISGNLPNIPVNNMVIDPASPSNTFYVATDVGVFFTMNGGTSWAVLGTGLPNVESMTMFLSPVTRVLRLGTHGRGVFDFPLPAINTPDFSFGTPNPASQQVSSGQTTGTYTIPVNSVNNFAGNVTLACSGLPAGAACNFTTNPVAVPAGGSVSAMFTISTTGATPAFNGSVTVTGTSGALSHNTSVTLIVVVPDFNFGTPNPTSQTVSAGQTTGTYTIPVNSVNNFNASVTLACSGLPTGAACHFTTNPVTPPANGSVNATFTISTTGATPAFNGSITITGTSGALSHNTSVTLIVIIPDFSMVTQAPTSQTVSAGSSTGNYTIQVNSTNGFNSAVTLACSGLPAGAACNFTTNPVTPPANMSVNATFTISTTGATPAFNGSITVTGTSGALSHNASVTLIVIIPDFNFGAPSPASRQVTAGQTTGTYTIPVNSVNNFAGNVTLACSGLPTGAACIFTTNPVAVPGGGMVNAMFTISTTSATPAFNGNVTVTGTSGALSHNTTVGLIVIIPDFSMTTQAPTSQTVSAGSSTGNYSIQVSSTNNFNSAVTLVCSGLPTGAACNFTTNPVTPPANGNVNATFTISTTGATPAFNGSITVTGTSGALSHNASVTLIVVIPDFSMTTQAPTSQTVSAGSSTGNYTIQVSSTNNFNSGVTLVCSGLPTGAACNFTTNPVTPPANGNVNATFTISTTGATPAFNGSITVTGTSGALHHTASVTLIVVIPDFSFGTPNPASNQAVAGQSTATYTIPITTVNGFTGNVTLTCSSGLPAGAACNFTTNPLPVPVGGASATFTIATSAADPAATSMVTVKGTSGTLSHNSSVQLVVVIPDFSFGTPNPASNQAVAGQTTASYTIPVNSVNTFSGNVTLTCPMGLPSSGDTCNFTTNPVNVPSGGSVNATFTIKTSSSDPAATSTVTVKGASGALSHTTTVQLVVVVPDANVATASPTSNSVGVGKAATYTFMVSSQNTFAGSVNFTCPMIQPATTDFTCAPSNFSPNPVMLMASGAGSSGSTTLTITPTANTLVPAAPAPKTPLGPWLLLTATLAAALLIATKKMPAKRRYAFALTVALAVAMLVSMVACGSSNGNPHTFTITVTGTTSPGNIAHSQTIMLTVHN
ncbi:MAG: beta strand repeat-containing protein [Candidatus Acidiferrales bacterium]